MTDDNYTLSNVECIDTSKSSHPISTGIGFFDHMLDQLNSHAQVGVAITVKKTSVVDNNDTDHGNISAGSATDEHAFQVVNRYGNEDQGEIMGQVGTALGAELRKLDNYPKENRTSRFCCPLDEALVECIITKPSNDDEEQGKLINFTLPPYGIYPANIGRTKIGSMETKHVQTFFTNLASSSGLNISLMKVRGDNGHHIVESAFKAFSRALRNLLDGTSTNEYTSIEFTNMWGNTSLSYTSGIELNREGRLERSTKETSILVHVLLNGGGGGGNTSSEEGEGKEGGGGNVKVHTGISTVDQFISILATEACMSLEVKCNGDLYVDDHHTSEDVSIALGQVLNVALGTKAGLNRMWCACGKYGGEFPYYYTPLLNVSSIHHTHDNTLYYFVSLYTNTDAEVEVTMDLSNRPCMTHNLSLSCNPNNEEYAGDISVEMLDHVLESLVMNSKSTVHIVEKKVGRNVLETALATAMAFGRALRMCAAVDPRRAGKTASSKGTLSV